MNMKEWEAKQNATKNSKSIADIYKSVSPKILASVGIAAKFNITGTETTGIEEMIAKIYPQLFGFANSGGANFINSKSVNIPSLASEVAAIMLKEVQPNLEGTTNQAILNLVEGVNPSASTNYGTKISASVNSPDLIKSAFESVAHLSGGVEVDKSSFFHSAASVSNALQSGLTEKASKNVSGVSGILKGMNTASLGVSGSSVSALAKSLGFQNLQSSMSVASISMDGIVSILKSLDMYQGSIADLCQVNVDEVQEDIELMDSDVDEKQDSKSLTEPLFTYEEFNEALDESINNQESFQVRVANWTEKKKKQYFLIILLLKFFIDIFIMPFLQENVGLPVSTQVVSIVKELPQKASKIVDKLEKGVEAIITENTNYYYKITYVDENGETKQGYVAKRNLIFVKEIELEENE